VIRLGWWGDPHRAPEPCDPIEGLAAQPALRTQVDGSKRGQLEQEQVGVVDRVGRVAQLQQLSEPFEVRTRRFGQRAQGAKELDHVSPPGTPQVVRRAVTRQGVGAGPAA